MKYSRVSGLCVCKTTIITMNECMSRLPKVFLIDVEASVMISEHLTLARRKSIDLMNAFLSILGDCNST